MGKLQSVRIKRFKAIEDAPIDLSDLNVLVGANNAGKSSIIQGLHFGIALLQSIALAGQWHRNVRKDADTLSTSISPNQIIYSPAEDIYCLGMGGSLREDKELAISIQFGLSSGEQPTITIRKGRNRNILVVISDAASAEPLASLENPFSVFSPGLAGVAKTETYVSDGVLLRTIARGDANLVLRNILYRLWNKPEWSDFIADLRDIFPKIDFDISYSSSTDEFIGVRTKFNGDWIPLDLVGTGVLQATQILSYIHRFSPSIVVLDEPDSHLHPNNQILLCNLLRKVARDRETQILLTTHSRHVVDAIGSGSYFLWVRNGTVDRAGEDDEIGILLDIGALDIKERIAQKAAAIVLTEDEAVDKLRSILLSSGFPEEYTVILPYHGVSSIKQLRPLVKMIRSANPNAKIILHRDRDYLTDAEASHWEDAVRRMGVEPFLTNGVDIESHFLNPRHLAAVNNVDEKRFEQWISDAIAEADDKSVQHYVNGRIAIERELGNASKINPGALAVEARKALTDNPMRFVHSKTVLKVLRKIFKSETKQNLQDEVISKHLEYDNLLCIAKKIPKLKSNNTN
jgi:hypothetical protein